MKMASKNQSNIPFEKQQNITMKTTEQFWMNLKSDYFEVKSTGWNNSIYKSSWSDEIPDRQSKLWNLEGGTFDMESFECCQSSYKITQSNV